MNTLTNYFIPSCEEAHTGGLYEVIENEVLKSCILKDLNVSGSLFSLTTFVEVTFQSCVFFGSKMENCNFVNCKFIDCEFQFSGISHCNFENTKFEEAKWEFTQVKKSTFEKCSVDARTATLISKEDNKIEANRTNGSNEMKWGWEEFLNLNNQEDLTATQTIMIKKAA